MKLGIKIKIRIKSRFYFIFKTTNKPSLSKEQPSAVPDVRSNQIGVRVRAVPGVLTKAPQETLVCAKVVLASQVKDVGGHV